MTLLSPVTLYFPSMNGSCILGIVAMYEVSIFFSAFNTLSYAYVSVLASLWWYANSDYFGFLFGLTLSPSSGIMFTGSLPSGSDVVMFSSSIPGTKYSLCVSRNIFRVSSGSVLFHYNHLTSLVVMTLLVSVLYNLYLSLVWFSVYPTTMALYFLYVICFLIFSLLVM